jgi:hypothetical protein
MQQPTIWNHPLQALARSLARTVRTEPDPASAQEFLAFLGRVVGAAAQGPVVAPKKRSKEDVPAVDVPQQVRAA